MKLGVASKARIWFGVLVLGTVVALGIWYFVSRADYATYQIRTHEAVSGLMNGAPVEFHGVQVGEVEHVELLDPDSVRVLVTVRASAPVTDATVAMINTRGLSPRGFTGYAYVALEDTRGGDRHVLTRASGQRFPEIRTAAAHREAIDAVANDINALLHTLLDRRTVRSLKKAIDSTRVVTSTLRGNNDKLAALLDNLERASRRLEPLLDEHTVLSLKDAIDNTCKITETLGDNTRQLASLLKNSEHASRQFGPLLDSTRDTLDVLHTQVLPKSYEALSRLETLSQSLEAVATEVSRNPSVLIRGTEAPPPGPGEQ